MGHDCMSHDVRNTQACQACRPRLSHTGAVTEAGCVPPLPHHPLPWPTLLDLWGLQVVVLVARQVPQGQDVVAGGQMQPQVVGIVHVHDMLRLGLRAAARRAGGRRGQAAASGVGLGGRQPVVARAGRAGGRRRDMTAWEGMPRSSMTWRRITQLQEAAWQSSLHAAEAAWRPLPAAWSLTWFMRMGLPLNSPSFCSCSFVLNDQAR